jgi:hypothetical protein
MPRPKGSKNKLTIAKESGDYTIALKELDKQLPGVISKINSDAVSNTDSWKNFFVGLGSATKDKTKHTEYDSFTPLDDDTLSQMYMGDGLSSRIVTCVADDETREWIYLEGSGAKTIEENMLNLEVEGKFNEAIRWQRLYGGSLIIIGAMDGQTPDMPLNTSKLKSIEYLKVVDRTSIPISECIFDKNPKSPTFGKVLKYKINYFVNETSVPMYVHHTRVIPFYNDPVPAKMRGYLTSDNRHWGMSSLQPIYESIRDLGGINQSVANILYEFVVGRFTVEHLGEMLANGQEYKLIKRMEILNMSKSIINAVILGENEKWERDYATVAGLPELIDRFMLQLTGSTGIPVTRLFGRSPAGLNATGENDLRNYYDIIESNQRNKLQLPIRTIVGLLSVLNKVETPTFTFNSLYQMTEKEKAECEKIYAETEEVKAKTEKIYVEMGARDSSETRKEKGWAEGDVPEEDDE